MISRLLRQVGMGLSLRVALALSVLLAPMCSPEIAPGAETPGNKPGVQVFASADESSLVIESVADGKSLSPVAEMTGAGGSRWFMVKTKNGNVGWIKAGDHAGAAKIDEHFRALPKEIGFITPGAGPAAGTSAAPASGAITIPVKIYGRQVLVPVTFQSGNSTATAYLVLDTGASQTMVSKRIARELRLRSIASQAHAGIGGSMVADAALVDAVRVGSVGLRNVPITIHDLPSAFGSEGLLGFDFLGRFQMSIDSDKQVLVLAPRGK